jgi:hypothetical protein
LNRSASNKNNISPEGFRGKVRWPDKTRPVPVGTLAKNFGAASPGWAVDVAAGETWNGKLWKIEAFRQSWHVLATERAQH